MRRVQCPACKTKVKVPDDHQKAFIRCTSCDKKIPLDDADDAPVKRAPPKSGMAGCLALVGYGLAALGALVCIGVAFLQPGVAIFLGVMVGLAVLLYGSVGTFILWFTNLMSGFGERLRVCAPWMGLQFLGVLLFVSPIALHSIAKNAGWFEQPAPGGDGHAKGNGNPPDKDGPAKKDGKDPVKAANPPKLKWTGDAALDKTLADLAFPDDAGFKLAVDRLIAMPPNQHRAVVAQHLANQLRTAPLHARTPLLRALGIWGTAQEVPGLIAMLSDKDINSRHEALQALGKLKDARAAGPMARCVLDLSTQYHAEASLKAMGPIAETEVRGLLKEPNTQIKVIAIRILGEIGTEQSIPDLQAATESVALRSAAQAALKAIGGRKKG